MIRFLLFIARFIISLTFIVSGFFKIMDPVGTGLIVAEYLNAAYVSFLSFLSIPGGIFLSLVELLTGIALLLKIRMRITSLVGLCLISFFTVLTLILAIFNPISDCGCFGEAIHLTNWQTFFKNLVLLACIIPIFLYRKSFKKVATVTGEWIFIGAYAIIALSVSLYSLARMPLIEFGNFKAGNNLLVKLDDAARNIEYNSVFIYEKKGKTKEFTLENLPDSTWTFVDSKSVAAHSGASLPFDFPVTTPDGEYITEALLQSDAPVFLAVITDMEKFDKKEKWSLLRDISDTVETSGGKFLLLTVSPPSDTTFDYAYSDYRTLITLNRSNGGIVYLNDAIVVKKWARGELKPKNVRDIIEEDYELITAKESITQQLIYEISIVLIFLTIILTRYICGIVLRKKKKQK